MKSLLIIFLALFCIAWTVPNLNASDIERHVYDVYDPDDNYMGEFSLVFDYFHQCQWWEFRPKDSIRVYEGRMMNIAGGFWCRHTNPLGDFNFAIKYDTDFVGPMPPMNVTDPNSQGAPVTTPWGVFMDGNAGKMSFNRVESS